MLGHPLWPVLSLISQLPNSVFYVNYSHGGKGRQRRKSKCHSPQCSNNKWNWKLLESSQYHFMNKYQLLCKSHANYPDAPVTHVAESNSWKPWESCPVCCTPAGGWTARQRKAHHPYWPTADENSPLMIRFVTPSSGPELDPEETLLCALSFYSSKNLS